MPTKTIDEYLSKVNDDDKRAALERLRRTIKAALPKAEECISYAIPAFRLNGKVVIGFGASVNHCALYPWSGSAVPALKEELKNFGTSEAKGAIHFQPDKPLPATLVRKIIKYRIAENLRRSQKSK